MLEELPAMHELKRHIEALRVLEGEFELHNERAA